MDHIFSRPFTPWEFTKFVAPAVISMVFIALYTVIDGLFVARFVGSDALAAINIVLPLFSLATGIGIMVATGGSALISTRMGEGRLDEARQLFSMVFFAAVGVGVLLSLVALIFFRPLLTALGATPRLYHDCFIYGLTVLLLTPAFIMKFMFEFFTRADGSSMYSLLLSITGGLIHLILDWILIVELKMGILGAAYATAAGVLISTLMGFIYFMHPKAQLRFCRFTWNVRALWETAVNGSSEMVTESSVGITTLIFNLIALKTFGENGVAALSILLYTQFMLVSAFLGFVAGVSPLISYNNGSGNQVKIRETMSYSRKFIVWASLLVFTLALAFSGPIVQLFVSTSSPVYTLAREALCLFAAAFLFTGFNVFVIGLFTALGRGFIAAALSVSRAIVGVAIGLAFLPGWLGSSGLWLTVPFAEALTLIFAFYLLRRYRFKYGY